MKTGHVYWANWSFIRHGKHCEICSILLVYIQRFVYLGAFSYILIFNKGCYLLYHYFFI
jgi:hypothetical protein